MKDERRRRAKAEDSTGTEDGTVEKPGKPRGTQGTLRLARHVIRKAQCQALALAKWNQSRVWFVSVPREVLDDERGGRMTSVNPEQGLRTTVSDSRASTFILVAIAATGALLHIL